MLRTEQDFYKKGAPRRLRRRVLALGSEPHPDPPDFAECDTSDVGEKVRGTVDFGQGPVTSVGAEDAFVAAF